MAKSYVRRYVRRQVRRGGRFLRRRYINKKGNFRVRKLVSDVNRLKSLINVEKKDFSGDSSQINFALNDSTQVLGRGDAIWKLNGPSQGTTAITRTGNSIKLTTINVSLRIAGQISLNDSRMFKIFFLQYVGKPDPAKDPTPDTATYDNLLVLDFLDYSSSRISPLSFRNKDMFRNWRVLKIVSGVVQPDMYSTGGDWQKNYNIWVRPAPGLQHLKFDGSSQDIEQNPIYVLFTCPGGDTNTSTGLKAEFHYRMNYVDN